LRYGGQAPIALCPTAQPALGRNKLGCSFQSATSLADLMHFGAGGRLTMLFLVLVLVVLWFLGVITKTTLGGLLHILLVVAIILGLVSFIGRRV
jgi:hypothetical protein